MNGLVKFLNIKASFRLSLVCERGKTVRAKRYSTYVDNRRWWTTDDAIQHLADSNTNKIVIMAGAGISTPSGLADFRTPGTGLYFNLEKYDLPYAEAIFDIDYFRVRPKAFLELAKDLYPGKYKPNFLHYFCRLIFEQGRLLRMYTQNIDGLERQAGIPVEKLVEAHGNFYGAHCIDCRKTYDTHEIREKIFADEIPTCKDQRCKGLIKPDIVFFGEALPTSFMQHVEDMRRADTLIVMGTALKVEPFASISYLVDEDTPRILLNMETVRSFVDPSRIKDVIILGDLEKTVRSLTDKLGWTEEVENLMKINGNFK